MPPTTVRFPTPEEEERSRHFAVHKNYLASLELFLHTLYGHGQRFEPSLVNAQRQLPAFRKIQRRKHADESELRRLLSISWTSELQLRVSAIAGAPFLRYSNAWAPVQAYYAVYMSIHAWLVTVGMGGLLDDHTRTLKSTVSHLVGRGLLPHPWSVACHGCPELRERVLVGLPQGADADRHVELLARPSLRDFYPRFAKMLETTRDSRLQRLRKEWLRQAGRKRMLSEQKRQLAGRLHGTTVFDYLWRLRIRSNYGDVSSFLMSGVSDVEHAEFHEGLVALTGGTCLLLQSLIVAQVGPKPFEDAAEDFTRGGGVDLGAPVSFLADRTNLLMRA